MCSRKTRSLVAALARDDSFAAGIVEPCGFRRYALSGDKCTVLHSPVMLERSEASKTSNSVISTTARRRRVVEGFARKMAKCAIL